MSDEIGFDPERTWLAVEARFEQEQDPVIKALLGQVRDHMKSEIGGEFDAVDGDFDRRAPVSPLGFA